MAIKEAQSLSFLKGGGEMGELIRSKDWSSTLLGAPHTWPQSLRTSVSLLLHSRFPMFVWWGPELITVYNDAYRIIAGEKHPQALGESGSKVWAEIWDVVGPLADKVMREGTSNWAEDQLLYINRRGYIEESYFTFSYSPIFDESGAVGGVFCACTETTEKVLAARKIQESERNLRNTILQSPVAMCILKGASFVVEIANERMFALWGKRPSEMLHQPVFEGLPEARNQGLEELLQHVYATGETFSASERPVVLPRNGKTETVYVNFVYEPFREGDGTISGIIAVAIDVTEQVASRKKVEESEQELKQFKFIADHAQDPFILMREDGTFAYLNTKALEAWGFTEEEARAIRVPDVDPIYNDEVFAAAFARAQKEAIPQFETLHKRKDGRIYPVEVNMVGLTLGGQPHLFAVARDISDRKKAEEALKQSNERFELVTKATQDAIWDWEIATDKEYRGEGFQRLLGISLAEMNPERACWQTLIHPEDLPQVKQSIQQVLDGTETYWEQEYRIRRKSGEYAYVRDKGVVLRDEQGQAIRMIGALKDVTETRYYLHLEKLEREILERNARSEKNMAETLMYYMKKIELLHPGMICSILERRGNQLFNLASPSLPRVYLDAIEGVAFGNNVGSCGTAAYLKEKVVVTDIQNDIRWNAYKEIAAQANLRACWSHPILNANGEVIATFACYYQEPKAPSRLEENTIKRTGHILQVILENYRKEEALKESNKRYEFVTKATSDAIWDWDIVANHIYFNEGYSFLFGHDHTIQILEKAWSQHLHEEDRQRVLDSFNLAITRPHTQSWQEEYRFYRADGSIAYVYDRGIILRDDSGRAIRMVGAMQDITERKQFEATLAQREEQFRTLANSIFQLAWMADGDGWIHWYNDRWYEYTGTTHHDMQGWGWQKVHHPEHVERVVGFIKEAWRKGEPWELTFPLRSKEGTYRWFLTRAYPVKDSDGKVIQWIGTNTDINEQKQLEVLLEDKVKERTTELERKNKELEQFAYAASHDMQEPLRKIGIFSNFLLEHNLPQLDERGKSYLTKIGTSVKRMKTIIDDLLQYSHQTRADHHSEWTDLNQVIDNIKSDLDLVIQQKGATIHKEQLPGVHAIPSQMHQLFFNLISNALKFTRPEVPPHITVCAPSTGQQAGDDNGQPDRKWVQISVSDNGIGFAQEYAQQIFSLFKRLHGRSEYEGTGIGLALCKKIVENHGGSIWAESQPGEGTTFHVLLPAN